MLVTGDEECESEGREGKGREGKEASLCNTTLQREELSGLVIKVNGKITHAS